MTTVEPLSALLITICLLFLRDCMASLSAFVILSSLVWCADSANLVISVSSLFRTRFKRELLVSGLLVGLVFLLNCLIVLKGLYIGSGQPCLLYVLEGCGCDSCEGNGSVLDSMWWFLVTSVCISYWATICDLNLDKPLWISCWSICLGLGIKDKPLDKILISAEDRIYEERLTILALGLCLCLCLVR